jgi:hypothetical protein
VKHVLSFIGSARESGKSEGEKKNTIIILYLIFFEALERNTVIPTKKRREGNTIII